MKIAVKKGKHRMLFRRQALTDSKASFSFTNRNISENFSYSQSVRISSDPLQTMAAKSEFAIPDLYTSFPLLIDHLSTETSWKQYLTVQECLPFLSAQEDGFEYNEHGIPTLDRERHIAFLHKSLKKLPAAFVTADASRPWIFYWCLNGLVTMGEDVSQYREPLMATIRSIQNVTGGFGGGFGQLSHLAPTYAIILALAIVGGPDSFDIIDRRAMWKWLGSLKQPDGGFQMAIDGEEDVRGAYCAVVIISLLNLPLELSQDSPSWSHKQNSLLTGLPEWISRCQTFEGGISARPDGEAHGAYTFCALACLCILGEPHRIIPQLIASHQSEYYPENRYLNVNLLISWLSTRQYAPEGGFSGRTNKLVDGCYSHWVGGCWPLMEACLDGKSTSASDSSSRPEDSTSNSSAGILYDREGLIRYILCCCQDMSKRGGLRDKPSQSDTYHTCYVLAGLSSAQNKWYFKNSPSPNMINSLLHAAFSWRTEARLCNKQLYDDTDRLNSLHPLFVIPEDAVQKIYIYFTSKISF
ncbi:Protein farnesyltransferase subunit beta [Erysiphe neolycopersici]|uniref:Protein farnesyltransferase subunit beta n=1 Tax=Erysiphe neolycopersici TaxID=212602 RepID=A0A420I4Z0_9PEZI|nr:Protein farnesyltransferase subunit beta [Erysiphe neolycopersici]